MCVCIYIYIYFFFICKPKQSLRIAGTHSVTELRCRVVTRFRD